MSTLITVLIVIASIVLILVVLVQKSKGGGLASNFSSSNAVMGVRKTTDFIEKVTWGLAGFVIIMSIAAVVVGGHHTVSAPKSEIDAPVVPTNQLPDVSADAPATFGGAPAAGEDQN